MGTTFMPSLYQFIFFAGLLLTLILRAWIRFFLRKTKDNPLKMSSEKKFWYIQASNNNKEELRRE